MRAKHAVGDVEEYVVAAVAAVVQGEGDSDDEDNEGDDAYGSGHSYGLSPSDDEMSDASVGQVGARRSSRAAPVVSYAAEEAKDMESEEEAEAEVVLDIALGQTQESEAEAAADLEQEPAPDAPDPQRFQPDPEVKASGSDEVVALAPASRPAADTSELVETTTKLCLYDVHVVFGTNGSGDAELWYCIQHKGSGKRKMTTCQYLELSGHQYRVLGGYEKFDVPVRYTFNKVQFIETTSQEHTSNRKNKKKTKKGKATVEATTMETLHENAQVSKLFDDFRNSMV
jgi:hypothetical protein